MFLQCLELKSHLNGRSIFGNDINVKSMTFLFHLLLTPIFVLFFVCFFFFFGLVEQAKLNHGEFMGENKLYI